MLAPELASATILSFTVIFMLAPELASSRASFASRSYPLNADPELTSTVAKLVLPDTRSEAPELTSILTSSVAMSSSILDPDDDPSRRDSDSIVSDDSTDEPDDDLIACNSSV